MSALIEESISLTLEQGSAPGMNNLVATIGRPSFARDALLLSYDGSLEGFLCGVEGAFRAGCGTIDFSRGKQYQPRIGQDEQFVSTDLKTAERVRRAIIQTGGSRAFEQISIAHLSDKSNTDQLCFSFIRSLLSTGATCARCPKKHTCIHPCSPSRANPVTTEVLHNASHPLHRLVTSVFTERHYLQQFLRFEEREGGIWYAQCNPKADIVCLLMPWFVTRFNTQPFIIYDETHHVAGVYDRRDWQLVKSDRITPPPRAENECEMQQAWRTFYRSVSVESRYHPELRRQFMPKRFWKNITEVRDELPR